MEQWLIDNVAELLILVVGGIIAFIKIRAAVQSNKREIDRMRESMDYHHTKDPNPHRSCDIETTRLLSLIEKLDRVERKLDVLDDRTIQILKHWRTTTNE